VLVLQDRLGQAVARVARGHLREFVLASYGKMKFVGNDRHDADAAHFAAVLEDDPVRLRADQARGLQDLVQRVKARRGRVTVRGKNKDKVCLRGVDLDLRLARGARESFDWIAGR
jgi:hypothetical protein